MELLWRFGECCVRGRLHVQISTRQHGTAWCASSYADMCLGGYLSLGRVGNRNTAKKRLLEILFELLVPRRNVESGVTDARVAAR